MPNEFLRLSDNFVIFSNIIEYFEKKIDGVKDIFELNKFFVLLRIIANCMLIIYILDKKKYEKLNIIIDDFFLIFSSVNDYNEFALKVKKSNDRTIYYLFKFRYEIDDDISYPSFIKFNKSISSYKYLNNLFFLLSNNKFYIPKAYEYESRKLIFNEKNKKMIEITKMLGNNYWDLVKFKYEIDLYLKDIISIDELEYKIIAKYRKEYYQTFYNKYILSYSSECIDENVLEIDYKSLNIKLMHRLLFFPYISIIFEYEKIKVIGPIYGKIINLLIKEEKEHDIIINRKINNDFIQYGLSFERYLKLLFQYRTFPLYPDYASGSPQKYYMLAKEIKDPLTINWHYLKVSSNKNSRKLFIINQINANGQYFDLLIIEIISDNDKSYCKLYFIQISVRKSIIKLKEILNNLYPIIEEYRLYIENNGMDFNNAYFYIISSENEIYQKLFKYCFNRNLAINITYEENQDYLNYYRNSFTFNVSKIVEMPNEQNYYDVISNYLKSEIFKNNPIISFSNEQLIKYSKFHEKIDELGYNFNNKIIRKFGKKVNIKFLVELEYKNEYKLRKNVLGISEVYENVIKQILAKSDKKELTTDKKTIKKTLRKKQIFWYQDKIIDGNGKAITCTYKGTFSLFKITKRKAKKK